MTKTERIIIDMRQATKPELHSLATLLFALQSALSLHGAKLQIKKSKPVRPLSSA